MYPQSLYENIVRGAALGVPIYITEIGAADRSDDDHVRLANIEASMHQARTWSPSSSSSHRLLLMAAHGFAMIACNARGHGWRAF